MNHLLSRKEQYFYGPAIPLFNSGNWNPGLHPRDSNGEFIYTDGGLHGRSPSGRGGSNPMVKGSEGFQIALRFILKEEVGDQKYYDLTESHPTIPAEGSGITIGIGYDLGQVSPAQFESDWGDLLDKETMARLRPYVQNPNPTQADLAQLNGIKIPWDAATKEFEQRTLPQAIQDTSAIYPQLDDIPSESQAALVSLVYNRGNDLKDKRGYLPKGDMRAIQGDLQSGQLTNVPKRFNNMSTMYLRIGKRALAARRTREGVLFSKGLVRKP
jgi:hypothetical protein